jgi:hypothetical protein
MKADELMNEAKNERQRGRTDRLVLIVPNQAGQSSNSKGFRPISCLTGQQQALSFASVSISYTIIRDANFLHGYFTCIQLDSWLETRIYTITGGDYPMMVRRRFFHHAEIYTSVFTINKIILVVVRRC